MKIFQDWQFLSLLTVIFWGSWGFLSKVATNKLNWSTMLVLFCLSTIVFIIIFSPDAFLLRFDKSSLTGLVAGMFGAFGFCFFYMALQKGLASNIIPVTSLYIVVAVILAFVFLHEPFTVKKAIGILLAVVAIYLLSG